MLPRTMPFAGAAASLSRLVASLSSARGVTTIRARLYFAFGCAAAMTIVCSLIALYAFTAIGGTATEIASRIMPATVHSLRLSEEASRLIASAPKLMAVEDGRGHATLIGDVTQQGENLTKRINSLQQFGEANIGELKAAQSMMLGRLNSLDAAVSDRLFMSAWRQNMAGAATRAHEQFVEGITPIVGYVNLDLMARSETSSGVALALSIEILRRLLEIQSDANLLAGALSEASTVTEASRLQPLRDHDRIGAAPDRDQLAGAGRLRASAETVGALSRHHRGGSEGWLGGRPRPRACGAARSRAHLRRDAGRSRQAAGRGRPDCRA